jgi:hypothetical protein
MVGALRHPAVFLFALLVLLQVALAFTIKGKRPPEAIVTPPPALRAAQAMSLGDDQFLYRALALEVQEMGDSGGRFSPLGDYNYGLLMAWFRLLDGLDARSDYVVSLAALQYGLTQKPEDAKLIAQYIREHAARDPAKKWRYLAHAAYIARHRGKDLDMALEIAKDLAAVDVPDIPAWTKQMPAFIMTEMGDKEAALAYLSALIATGEMSEEEKIHMHNYIQRRLK